MNNPKNLGVNTFPGSSDSYRSICTSYMTFFNLFAFYYRSLTTLRARNCSVSLNFTYKTTPNVPLPRRQRISYLWSSYCSKSLLNSISISSLFWSLAPQSLVSGVLDYNYSRGTSEKWSFLMWSAFASDSVIIQNITFEINGWIFY